MQFENLDKKIKEAADHHHPAYDENAWKKMENLLDEHLPQKKDDRRRIIFFILFFLVLGGGAWLLVSKPWNSSKPVTVNTEKTNPVISSSPTRDNATLQPKTKDETATTNSANEKEIAIGQDKNDQSISPKITSHQYINGLQDIISDKLKKTVKKNSTAYQKTVSEKNDQSVVADKNGQDNTIANQSLPVTTTDPNNINTKNDLNNTDTKDVSIINSTPVKAEDKNVNKPVDEKNDQPVTSSVTAEPKKNSGKNKKNNFFSFSLSAGPDISKVGSSSIGRTTLSYGAGINYTMNRFTLHTGFYVAKKIYSADGSEYKLAYQPPPNIKLTNVAANCNVFEIPLNLTYNFAKNKKGGFYAGAGLSSYIMKKEKYTYLYTYSSGQTYQRNDAVSNKNKHYFSIANVMVGYTRQISNKVSVSAEPYIKLPLTGIGMGKVHLNSGGILFTVGVKPFAKKTK